MYIVEMTVDEMSIDKMTIDKMSVEKIYLDKIVRITTYRIFNAFGWNEWWNVYRQNDYR